MIASSLIDLVHSSRKACLLASGALAAFLASALPSHAQLQDDVIQASYASTSQVKAGVISGTNFTIGTVGTTSGLWRELYSNIGGDITVSSLTSNSKFPNSPDSQARITSAATTTLNADSYGQRWTGWITPTVTGNYRFYLASDDGSELWLGTGDQPATAVRILELSGWAPVKQWSETLEAGSWSTETVTQQITSTQEALETVKASIPKGSTGKRFLRLKVQAVSGN